MKEKAEDITKPAYETIDIKAVLAPPVPESNVHSQETQRVRQDMTIGMVDIDSLKYKVIEDVQLIYKRVTGKGISPMTRNNKQRFIDKLTELKAKDL